jgi:2,5-furandicarboxylate decarboxylase 1
VPKDLRTFIAEIAERFPEDIRTVDEEVDPRFGVTAVAARFERDGKYPALFFPRVRHSRLPVVVNLSATYERLALGLGTTVPRMVETYGERQTRPIKPVIVDRARAPVKDVVITGADATLDLLPIPTHNALDAGPYLTGAFLVCRDPDTDIVNVGLYRHQRQGSHQLGVWFIKGHHGAYIQEKYESLGQDMPVAIVIGHHPGVVMGAISRLPGYGGEYEEAGALMQEPVELVKAELSDLPVPARAEIVIEGVIPASGRADEGPFAEWPGHYTESGPKPYIAVQSISMRHDAIFYDVFAGHREHTVLGSLPRMGSVYRRVKQVVPGVVNVNVPAHVRMHCYISYRKTSDTEAKKAAFAALLTEPENFKTIVLVDDDIDVFNEPEVMWAIGTRCRAERDILFIPDWSDPGGLNPSAYEYFPDGTKAARKMTAMVIDATKPAPPAKYPPRALVPEEHVDRVDLERIIRPFSTDLLEAQGRGRVAPRR